MIAVQLRELRDERGLTNKELADLSGVSLATVNRIMNGQTDAPSYQTICDLVMAMGGSLDELAGISVNGQPVPPPMQPDESKDLSPEMARLYVEIIKSKNQIIAEKDAWIKRVFIICCGLIVVLVVIVIADLLDPYLGFIRRN